MANNGKINHYTEVLLSNYVDKNFQNMLVPLNVMQHICFCPKFRIMNNFITPNQLLQNIKTVLGYILFMTAFIIRFIISINIPNGGSIFFNFLDLIFYTFGLGINSLCCIINSKSNIDLIWIVELESSEISIAIKRDDGFWNRMFKMYVNIQDAFTIFKKVYQVQILFHVVESFFHALLYLHGIIERGENEDEWVNLSNIFHKCHNLRVNLERENFFTG
ncbi:uncharacterized protein LOC132903341 [Amyelois transitella]|uniref:uncharacterized protein LOC132903341 n=1 Tax=Amyelois transitella TaxID=680683 RepID=UPI0029904A4C|nr:uncharacterized protein LOC132903341 [Amyelois transitella]